MTFGAFRQVRAGCLSHRFRAPATAHSLIEKTCTIGHGRSAWAVLHDNISLCHPCAGLGAFHGFNWRYH